MKLLLAASELYPFAKVGGLADAVASLADALAERGHKVYTILPEYGFINTEGVFTEMEGFTITSIEKRENLLHLFVKHPIFERKGIYGEDGKDYPDNFERFTFFSRAVVETAIKLDVDVLHLNDWHTAFASLYRKVKFMWKPPVLYTIHNLAYQGWYEPSMASKTGLEQKDFEPYLENGMINFMKIGILTANLINTVSPTYAKEIQTPEYGEGLHEYLRSRKEDLYGILNGIDMDVWKPDFGDDPFKGKKEAKEKLQMELNLEKRDVPLFGIVSRLAEQKGIDILLGCIKRFLSMDVQFVLLGTGDPGYHQEFEKIRKEFPRKTSINLRFDAELAMDIYRGSDFFLMPSRFEPCGLGQMIALVNGTIPIVRKTGGLADTVMDFNPETGEGNGFVFEEYTPEALLRAIKRAIDVYNDKENLNKLVKRGLTSDFSWNVSAGRYEELYRKLSGIS